MNQPARPLEIAAFLDRNGWGEASVQPFDGDFSTRRYARLTDAAGRTILLMDADANQKTPEFVKIANILRKMDIAAPEIYAALPERGLALLEDFGTRNVGALIDSGETPKPYFLRAAEVLAQIHNRFDRADSLGLDLPLFTAELFTTQAELFLDSYMPFAKQRETAEVEREDFRAAWQAVLRPVDVMPKSLMLRDFMPDNLMDLPKDRIGVLDFQDGGIGPVAYDLASLCEEVRRDGGAARLPETIAHYRNHAQNPPTEADLMRGCTILSAQRHTRILGVIARVALAGRRDKLAFLPRVEKQLETVTREPCLAPVREWMERHDILPKAAP